MNFSVSNKRPCSYYQPEASLTQDSLQEKKKQHSELTPFCNVYSKPTQETQTKPR